MNTTLPQAVAAFVRAKNEHDSEALMACFAPNAVVYDDGAEIRGSQAIKEWGDEINQKYQLTMEPSGLTELDNETILTALVSGNFDGSPLEFRYHFTLSDGKITSLTSELS